MKLDDLYLICYKDENLDNDQYQPVPYNNLYDCEKAAMQALMKQSRLVDYNIKVAVIKLVKGNIVGEPIQGTGFSFFKNR